MKKGIRWISLLLCLVMLFSFGACDFEKTNPAEEAILSAFSAVESMNNLKQEINVKITRQVGNNVYKEELVRTANYLNRGSGEVLAEVKDQHTIGDLVWPYTTVYQDGKAYLTFTGGSEPVSYHAEIAQEDFLADQIPDVIFETKNYDSISFDPSDATYVLLENPKKVESWAAPEYAEIISGSGKVKLSEEGQLKRMTYQVEYRQGGAVVQVEYTVKVEESTRKADKIEIPDDADALKIDRLQNIILMLQAQQHLAATRFYSATVNETSYMQAINLAATTQRNWDTYGTLSDSGALQDDYILKGQGNVFFLIDSQQQSSTSLFEYKDGVLYETTDGEKGESRYSEGKIAETMQQYFSFYSLDYLDGVINCTDLGDYYLLEYNLHKDMGEAMGSMMAQRYLGDADALNNLATDYVTTEIKCHVALDKDTLVPSSMGLVYSGYHTIEGVNYTLSTNVTNALYAGDPDSYYHITGKLLPDEKPKEEATPLFYQVTSSEGKKMYLFGTIHIGDERTAYLPKEIYQALDESDALAVEFNLKEFEKKMEQDKELQKLIAETYYFTDGSSAKDMLSQELYESARNILKAIGADLTTADNMRPSIWANLINETKQRALPELISEKGVDNRLLAYAKEKDIPVLEVESAQSQMSLYRTYSKTLQSFLLQDSVEVSRAEYAAATRELYELWCAGDEKTLREALATEELPEGTDVDIVEANKEYNKLMMTDRDKAMLEKAKSYMEGDQVVFFAVGLAHLLGETGLVDALQEAGYTVERITFGE